MRLLLVFTLLVPVIRADDFVITNHGKAASGLFVVTDRPQSRQPAAVITGTAPNKAASGCYLVKFTAQWCGPCRHWDKTERPRLRSPITIVDVDRHPEWTTPRSSDVDAAVTSVPTFWAVDRGTGEPVSEWVGHTAATVLDDFVRSYAATVEREPEPIVVTADGGKTHQLVIPTERPGRFKFSARTVPDIKPEAADSKPKVPGFNRLSEINHLLDPRSPHADKFTRSHLETLTDMQLIDLHNREHGVITINGVRQQSMQQRGRRSNR